MSSDRSIQLVWPLKLSKGTNLWTLTPSKQDPLSQVLYVYIWVLDMMFAVAAMLPVKS